MNMIAMKAEYTSTIQFKIKYTSINYQLKNSIVYHVNAIFYVLILKMHKLGLNFS